LDAAARIYSCRVDSVHSETYRVLGTFSEVAFTTAHNLQTMTEKDMIRLQARAIKAQLSKKGNEIRSLNDARAMVMSLDFTDLKDLMNENGLILDDETMDAETEKKKVEEMLMRYQLPTYTLETFTQRHKKHGTKQFIYFANQFSCLHTQKTWG